VIELTGTYTDQYQLAMAQVYFLKGRHQEPAVFDYFFRKLPFGGGYAVFAGLDDLLEILEKLYFSREDIEFLRKQGMHPQFLGYLEEFEFTGNLYSSQEGDLIFPTRPVVSVEAPIIEAQVIETLLLNLLNFQTLIATKASRIRMVAGDRKLVDFGLRRAHGAAGYLASRAAVIGGFDATSNVRAGQDYGIPVSGTMAHSFVQSYDDEFKAFLDFSEERPENCVLLVDTYNTLESGIPNAIRVAREMEKRGQRLLGVRLDSGDLAYLAKRARGMLDSAGLGYVRIAASNQLDEYVIKSLLEQEAPIDLFGVGTSLVTGQPDGALDGVYKLAAAHRQPRIKLSESTEKITLPHLKQVFRVLENGGAFFGADAVGLAEEEDVELMHHPSDPLKSLPLDGYPKERLLHPVMREGRRIAGRKSLEEIARYCRDRLDRLPAEYKRFDNPHIYKVGLSDRLRQERDRLVQRGKGSRG
jgi:nicotinate phosphoribosyltransferase